VFASPLSSAARKVLRAAAPLFENRRVIIGKAGNFAIETALQDAKVKGIYSADTSLRACSIGWYLTKQPVQFEIIDPEFAWINHLLESDLQRAAAVPVIRALLGFRKRDNAFKQLQWDRINDNFSSCLNLSAANISNCQIGIDGFEAASIVDHFSHFGGDPNDVFIVHAPAGPDPGLALDQVIAWNAPPKARFGSTEKLEIFAWLKNRRFIWFDEENLPCDPVMIHKAGRTKTTYCYSNLIDASAFINERPIGGEIPNWLILADHNSSIRKGSDIKLVRLKTTELTAFKDLFLGKNVNFSTGTWAFAVEIDGLIYGFIEYSQSKFGGLDGVYLNADFGVPYCRYPHISKLMVMLATCAETAKLLSRMRMYPTRSLATTAFTERPVSMKYRGVLELVKRGQTADGQKFLQYEGKFSDATWKQTLKTWLNKHSL
jgi:hypothetical protein